jgi:hypothetical protein
VQAPGILVSFACLGPSSLQDYGNITINLQSVDYSYRKAKLVIRVMTPSPVCGIFDALNYLSYRKFSWQEMVAVFCVQRYNAEIIRLMSQTHSRRQL